MSLGTLITRLADSRVPSSQTVRHEDGGTVCCFRWSNGPGVGG